MIYCVIPEPLSEELLDKLNLYYAADPNVTVIVDRRESSRRAAGAPSAGGDRSIRDRRRKRITGELSQLASDLTELTV